MHRPYNKSTSQYKTRRIQGLPLKNKNEQRYQPQSHLLEPARTASRATADLALCISSSIRSTVIGSAILIVSWQFHHLLACVLALGY